MSRLKGSHLSAEQRQKISAAGKGRKKTPEHLAKIVAARKANGWFAVTDIGERIRAGKQAGWAAKSEEEKEAIRENARRIGRAKAKPRTKKCEYPDCPKILQGQQSRFCGREHRNKVIKAYSNGYERKGEYRQCALPACHVVKFFPTKQLRPDGNYCTRSHAAKARVGQKNPNYRHGNAVQYMVERKGPKVKQWRDAVFARDEYRCQRCGATTNLHAHHIKEWVDFPELRYDVANGLTVCLDCHETIHGHRIGHPKGAHRVMVKCAWCNEDVLREPSKVRDTNFCDKSHTALWRAEQRRNQARAALRESAIQRKHKRFDRRKTQ